MPVEELHKSAILAARALMETDRKPSVWIVDPSTQTVSLRNIRVERFTSDSVVVADGLKPEEFDTYGATARTLRQFVKAYHDLVATVNDIVMPNPDVKR